MPTRSKAWKGAKVRARALARALRGPLRLRPVSNQVQGVSLARDIRRLTSLQISTVIDVGANIGQSALQFARWWPDAQILCFEPHPAAYDRLRSRTHRIPNILPYKLGLSAMPGTAPLFLHAQSAASSLAPTFVPKSSVMVTLTTLGNFATAETLDRIDFLKIDTEGHDLAVLEGAESLLADGRISLIQVEAGMNPDNRRHVPLQAFNEYLGRFDYRMFGVYEQFRDAPLERPYLRRVNAVFIQA